MSLAKRLIKGTAIFSSSTFLLTPVQFLTSVLLIRSLSKQDYGNFVLILSIYSASSAFLDLGIGRIVASEIARSRGNHRLDQVKHYLIRYIQLEIGVGGLLCLASFLFAFRGYSMVPSISAVLLLLLIGIYLLLTAIKNLLRTTFYGYTIYEHQALLNVIEVYCRLGLVVVLLPWFGNRAIVALWAYVLALLLALLVALPFWWKVMRQLKSTKLFEGSLFKKLLIEQGKFVVLSEPVKSVRDQIPVWGVEYLLGTESLATFAVAQSGYRLVSSFFMAFEDAVLPLTSEKIASEWKSTKSILQKGVKYAFWFGIISIAGGWFLAPLLFQVLFSAKYLNAVPIFRMLLITLPVAAFALITRPLLYALEGQKYLFFCYLASVLLVFALLWTLIPPLGLLGAPLALILTTATITAMRYYYINKLQPDFRVPFKTIFVFDEVDRRMLARIRRLRTLLQPHSKF